MQKALHVLHADLEPLHISVGLPKADQHLASGKRRPDLPSGDNVVAAHAVFQSINLRQEHQVERKVRANRKFVVRDRYPQTTAGTAEAGQQAAQGATGPPALED